MRLRVETGVTLIVRCCLSVFFNYLYDKLSHAIDCPIPSLMSQEYSLFYRAEGVVRRTPSLIEPRVWCAERLGSH